MRNLNIVQASDDADTWLKICEDIFQEATRLDRENHCLVCVFDIDNTLFIPYECGGPEEGCVIRPVHALYDRLRSAGLKMCLVTARTRGQDNINVDLTRRELESHGIVADELFFRPEELYEGNGESAIPVIQKFKRDCRKFLENCGYTILVNVGDRDSDFKGGHFHIGLQIPESFTDLAVKDHYHHTTSTEDPIPPDSNIAPVSNRGSRTGGGGKRRSVPVVPEKLVSNQRDRFRDAI
jgi:hypothetical protein